MEMIRLSNENKYSTMDVESLSDEFFDPSKSFLKDLHSEIYSLKFAADGRPKFFLVVNFQALSDLSVDFDIPFSFAYVIASSIEVTAMIFIMASMTWQVLIVATFGLVATKYTQGY
uniref:ABC transporter C family member 8-like n=1 Tax=Tanacetum cinerariifolium TaxID=118510 RepID=A0A699IVW8_TANCI|nr:ABC transporter C family member 8-like [Tanacetum cinerariifolium]